MLTPGCLSECRYETLVDRPKQRVDDDSVCVNT